MGKKKPLDDEQAGEAVPEEITNAVTEPPAGDEAPVEESSAGSSAGDPPAPAATPERLSPEEWAERKGHTDPKPGAIARGIAHMKGWILATAAHHAGWGTARAPLEQQEIRDADGNVSGHRNVVLITEAEYEAAVTAALGISCKGQ